MRWMLLLAFAVTVPAFVALVAWWTARTERPPGTSPRRRRGTPLAAIPDAPDHPRHRPPSPAGGVAVARTRPSSQSSRTTLNQGVEDARAAQR